MNTQLIDRGVVWQCSYDRGWWTATDGKQVIKEREFETLEASVKASDPNNPRIDGVAFADFVPGMGAIVGKF
jgi:hypothetical protein